MGEYAHLNLLLAASDPFDIFVKNDCYLCHSAAVCQMVFLVEYATPMTNDTWAKRGN